jgi:hypothetical protein
MLQRRNRRSGAESPLVFVRRRALASMLNES